MSERAPETPAGNFDGWVPDPAGVRGYVRRFTLEREEGHGG